MSGEEKTLLHNFRKKSLSFMFYAALCSHLFIFENILFGSSVGFWLEEIFCISLDLVLTASGFE